MAERCKQKYKKRLALFCAVFLLLLQCVVLVPDEVCADDDDFVVRVQYFGERGDKLDSRIKAVFSRSDLEAMSEQFYYTNVTNVGTVMTTSALGVPMESLLDMSGIDIGSIMSFTFRVTDNYTENFSIAKHVSEKRYFYPYLAGNYERGDNGTIIPLKGSLADYTIVPSIMAVRYGSSKSDDADAFSLPMSVDGYRFCLGQTKLTENVQTKPGYDGGDVSSRMSAHSIKGIDITLYGSPVQGIDLSIDGKDIKVGSEKKITAVIKVDELFADSQDFDVSNLQWSSSDETIATVDENGVVSVKKKGQVTITATAPDGTSASIVINGVEKEGKSEQEAAVAKDNKTDAGNPDNVSKTDNASKPDKSRKPDQISKPDKVSNKVSAKTILVKEITLGDEIAPDTEMNNLSRKQMTSDAEALGENEEYSRKTAAGSAAAALAACGAGAVIRVRRYKASL